MTYVRPSAFDTLLRHAANAADIVALHASGSGAERTRAAVARALDVLLANGLIAVTPPEDWPVYVALDPPYELPRSQQ